ncbi:MAG TPA: hypothetical protein VJT67_13115 [Longimicrobiaceae bacterium]|nr:hypothetical protein [Longimicrobiaceae bacterium]
MIPAVLTALLYLGFTLLLATSGFVSGLAGRDWLFLSALTLLCGVSGVLLYRGALRPWVRHRGHPASLRLFAMQAAIFAWFTVALVLFWQPATHALPWGDSGIVNDVVAAAVDAVAALLLGAEYTGRRRIGAA